MHPYGYFWQVLEEALIEKSGGIVLDWRMMAVEEIPMSNI
jgi:hypothetical protein